MDRAQVREVDDRVAVRVASAHVAGLHLDATEEDGGLVAKDHPWCAGLVVAHDVRARVLVRDDLRVLHEVGVTAGVVEMMVGVEDVANRLVGDAADLGGDEVVAVQILVVDDDDPCIGDPHRHVSARHVSIEARNHIEAVLDLANL